jgi:hypothetical protein
MDRRAAARCCHGDALLRQQLTGTGIREKAVAERAA